MELEMEPEVFGNLLGLGFSCGLLAANEGMKKVLPGLLWAYISTFPTVNQQVVGRFWALSIGCGGCEVNEP